MSARRLVCCIHELSAGPTAHRRKKAATAFKTGKYNTAAVLTAVMKILFEYRPVGKEEVQNEDI